MQIETHDLRDDGLVPNNPALPLTVYREALPAGDRDAAQRIIAHFARNGWTNAWINGIYGFHHYHASAHEVLGIACGSARVQFGGDKGPIVDVAAGDVVLIPAGVGHCRISASDDLSVVGAYPGGAEPDLKRATTGDRAQSLAQIGKVGRWERDPVRG